MGTSETQSTTWPGGIARRLQILRDGFDSRLEPIAFDIYTGWLLTQKAQAHFAVSLNYGFQFNIVFVFRTAALLFWGPLSLTTWRLQCWALFSNQMVWYFCHSLIYFWNSNDESHLFPLKHFEIHALLGDVTPASVTREWSHTQTIIIGYLVLSSVSTANLNNIKKNKIFLYMCRGPSPRLSACATQLRRNITAMVSRWRHCVQFDQPGNQTQVLQHQ